METYKNILKKGHLLIVGKTELEREKFITELINISGYESFRFPKNMKTFNDYFNAVKKMKVYKPSYVSTNYNEDAIWDFHREWILRGNSSLVILEEIECLEEISKFEIIERYIKALENREIKSLVRLIISQNKENNLIERLANETYFENDYNRTNKQIVEQNLKIIDIEKIKNEHIT